MMERFKRTGSSGQSRKIKDWTREALNLSDEYSILVTELKCSEPNCPPIETVIAVLGPQGKKYQYKVHLPIEEVTEAEVRSIGLKLKQEMAGVQSIESENCDEHH